MRFFLAITLLCLAVACVTSKTVTTRKLDDGTEVVTTTTSTELDLESIVTILGVILGGGALGAGYTRYRRGPNKPVSKQGAKRLQEDYENAS